MGRTTWPLTIEHRLFSHITHNWRGRPLTSHDVVIETIAATRTRAGLRVEARLDRGDYPTGIAISKDRFAALPPGQARDPRPVELHSAARVRHRGRLARRR
ncbi:hypothetical protein ACFUJR_32930 [Streptomyces sp. NPDC057271]|uniref:ISAzo13-like element transposase-related protein n=1 Tax=Streptomyces sp. NPDC057271 TaxID=3346078 RepID=UPI003633E8D6